METTKPLATVNLEISLDYTTIGLLVGGLFLAIVGALIIYKKI